MKKILSIVAAVMVSVNIAAEGHLTFKGVEIDGSKAQFSRELVKQDYTILSETGDGIVLIGPFAGLEDCIVAASITPKEKLVCSVGVFLPEQYKWILLKSMYNDFKDALTEKYGEPYAEINRFDYPFEEGDGYEMLALYSNSCIYAARYITELGTIDIIIKKAGRDKGQIIISYIDKINSQLKEDSEKKAKNEDL